MIYTAMVMYCDEFKRPIYRNARINAYKSKQSAVKAIISKSPHRSGVIQIGQRIIAIVRNGILTELPSN